MNKRVGEIDAHTCICKTAVHCCTVNGRVSIGTSIRGHAGNGPRVFASNTRRYGLGYVEVKNILKYRSIILSKGRSVPDRLVLFPSVEPNSCYPQNNKSSKVEVETNIFPAPVSGGPWTKEHKKKWEFLLCTASDRHDIMYLLIPLNKKEASPPKSYDVTWRVQRTTHVPFTLAAAAAATASERHHPDSSWAPSSQSITDEWGFRK